MTAIHSILVANRGEIAARVLRTVKALGMRALLVAHAVDGRTPAMGLADDLRMIEGVTPVAAFLDGDGIIAAALEMGADAIHPGYGFLSENAEFARSVEASGMVWIGPAPQTIELMGDKVRARRFVEEAGYPVAPSAIEDDDPATFVERARSVGTPLLIKPSAGGGGKGMRIVRDLAMLEEEIETARSEGKRYFGDGRLFAERYVERPRHIEVQILGDAHGNIVHLFERECSLQRRFQKVIEEAPSAALDDAERAQICGAATGIAKACGYRGAGTVEFIHGAGAFYFLEMNTRLQVEHPVTEAITGLDLVAEQIAVAAGAPLRFAQADIKRTGHALEARIYAEDPGRGFVPTTGPILRLCPPAEARFDSGIVEGARVHSAFDPMLAKLIAHGSDREDAIAKLRKALRELVLLGLVTNIGYLDALLGDEDVAAGQMHTGMIAEKPWLAEAPSPEGLVRDALIAAAALSIPDVRGALDSIPAVHAAIGDWRN